MIRKSALILLLATLLVADVVGSGAIWRGAPLDSSMKLSFWHFEVIRLRYWVIVVSFSAMVGLITNRCFPLFLSRAKTKANSRIHQIAIGLTTVLVATVVEVSTSLWYWRSSPWTQSGCSEDPNCPYGLLSMDYLSGHLVGWAGTVLVSAAVRLTWNWARQRGTMERMHV